MENQPHPSLKIGDMEIHMIGIRKYEHLKSLKPESLTETEKHQVEVYESKRNGASTQEQAEILDAYFQKINSHTKSKSFQISAKKLWQMFLEEYPKINSRPFIKVDGVSIPNMEPLIYYFSKDKRFFECRNLLRLSEPSFDKGLLIIGTFGNGKTSTMKVFESLFRGATGMTFKGFSANEAVIMFEQCKTDADREEFDRKMIRGNRYFDDVKTERIASNFGKVNIFKEILEQRYDRRNYDRRTNPDAATSKTYITCNFKEGFEGDIDAAIEEFGEKYGGRVYDRIFEMFNIIQFNGRSFRK